MKKVFLGLMPALLAACASKEPGLTAAPRAGNPLPLKITAVAVDEYSDEFNSVVSLTFQNTGERWIHVDEVGLDFANESSIQQNVILGEDLKAWAESYKIRKQVENFNDSLGITAAILGGTLVAIVSGKSGDTKTAAVGGAVATGASGYQAIKFFRTNRQIAEVGEIVPDGHVYRSFSIPPKGYARRWFLLNTPQKLIVKKFAMNVHSVELGEGGYEVPLKE